MAINSYEDFNFIHHVSNTPDIVDPYQHDGYCTYHICPNLMNRQIAYASNIEENPNQQQQYQQQYIQNTNANNNINAFDNQINPTYPYQQNLNFQSPPVAFAPPPFQPPPPQSQPQPVQQQFPPVQPQQPQVQVIQPPVEVVPPPPSTNTNKKLKKKINHRPRFSSSSSSSSDEDIAPKPKIEESENKPKTNDNNNNYNHNNNSNNRYNNNNNNNNNSSIPDNAVCRSCGMSKYDIEAVGGCKHYLCSMCAKEFCRENHDSYYNYFCPACGKNGGKFTLDELKERGILDNLDIKDLNSH